MGKSGRPTNKEAVWVNELYEGTTATLVGLTFFSYVYLPGWVLPGLFARMNASKLATPTVSFGTNFCALKGKSLWFSAGFNEDLYEMFFFMHEGNSEEQKAWMIKHTVASL